MTGVIRIVIYGNYFAVGKLEKNLWTHPAFAQRTHKRWAQAEKAGTSDHGGYSLRTWTGQQDKIRFHRFSKNTLEFI
jgi:hypothetical protein